MNISKAKSHVLTACALFLIVMQVYIARGHAQAEQAPAVVSLVAPKTPWMVARLAAEETVWVRVQIGGDGAVKSAAPLSGHPLLQTVVLDAARRWRFNPAPGTETRTALLEFAYIFLPKGTSFKEFGVVFVPPYRVEIREPEDLVSLGVRTYGSPRTRRKRRR